MRCDRDIIERVPGNLLTNAIKFSPLNGNIEIKAVKADDDFLRLSVSDQGTGIPPEKLDSLFNKFYQGKKKYSGNIRSSGLGLTFCKLAVENHSGKIGIISPPKRRQYLLVHSACR